MLKEYLADLAFWAFKLRGQAHMEKSDYEKKSLAAFSR